MSEWPVINTSAGLATPDVKPASCLNCGDELLPRHRYCPGCGQDTNPKITSLGAIGKDFLENYFTFDSKLFRSLFPLLFRPGFLTEEYIRGRRARYIPPLRMYLSVSLLAFLLLALNKPVQPVYQSDEITAEELEEIKRDLSASKPGQAVLLQDPDMQVSDVFWDNFFNSTLPKLFFLMVPLAAFILAALYRRGRRYYVEYMIFSLHFHSFVFVVLLLYLLLSTFLLTRQVFVNQLLGGTFLLLVLTYLYLALKRVYGQRWGRTLVKFGLLLSSYSLTFVIFLLIALLVFYQATAS
jgi:hypothetical protein